MFDCGWLCGTPMPRGGSGGWRRRLLFRIPIVWRSKTPSTPYLLSLPGCGQPVAGLFFQDGATSSRSSTRGGMRLRAVALIALQHDGPDILRDSVTCVRVCTDLTHIEDIHTRSIQYACSIRPHLHRCDGGDRPRRRRPSSLSQHLHLHALVDLK